MFLRDQTGRLTGGMILIRIPSSRLSQARTVLMSPSSLFMGSPLPVIILVVASFVRSTCLPLGRLTDGMTLVNTSDPNPELADLKREAKLIVKTLKQNAPTRCTIEADSFLFQCVSFGV